ncbi:MAG TPA: hypothetical protein VE398_26235 [Acidobacteriota bacterium]|nr:hypothetical protein [Acidobacteriota bacterium]
MPTRHWSDEEVLARLYGVGPEDGHIEVCQDCRTRLEAMELRRKTLLDRDLRVPAQFLAEQRRSIYERLERRPLLLRLRLVPSLAMVLFLFVILTMFRPSPQEPPRIPVPDAQVFEDVFDIASSTEPSAVEPVRSLFEVQQ